ncbi:MAG: hypothetical protein LAQ30_30590 [Acidobacteriia bacterium]|nr:hypothetical protein [Terriglobia bacterium]
MTLKWTYFLGASLLAAYFLLAAGAPLPAVAAGIGGAALFLRRKSRAA